MGEDRTDVSHSRPLLSPVMWFLLVSLLGLLAWGVFTLHRQQDELAQQRVSLQAHAKALAALSMSLEHQATLLGRLTGDVLPIRMPEKWEAENAALQSMLSDQARWPDSASAAHAYWERVGELIRRTPSWAEDQYLDSLNTLRWTAQFFLLQHAEHDLHWERLDEYLADLEELQRLAPEGANADLRRALEQQLVLAGERSRERVKEGLLEYGRELLSQPDADSEALKSVLSRLQWLDANGGTGELEAQLRVNLLVLEARAQGSRLQQRYEALRTLAASHPGLVQHGVTALASELLSIQTVLALEGLDEPGLDELSEALNGLHREQRERQAKVETAAWLAYQKWALGEIEAFRAKYGEAVEAAKANAPLPTMTKWKESEYQQIADAAKQHLLPIDSRHLDWLPSEAFNDAMTIAKTGLDSKEAREVYKRLQQESVPIDRRTLADFMENGR